jgi:hypothetical protein
MALEFLKDIGNLANTVNKTAGPLTQILGAIRGNKTPSAPTLRDQILDRSLNRRPSEHERYAVNLLKALGQPGNSYVNSVTDEEFRNLRGSAQADIRSKVLSDRRERSMGRSGTFFDPERADENIAFQISRGTPMLRQQAQQNAIKRILAAAGVGDFATAADARDQSELNSMASLYALDTLSPQTGGSTMQTQMPGLFGRSQQGLDGLQQILKIFSENKNGWEKPETYGPKKPETIRWNQMRYNA